jgi:hypothetical protein
MARVFSITPNAATVAIENLMTGNSELRAVRPEAEMTINGVPYVIGGLVGQPVQNYLTEDFLSEMKADNTAFQLIDIKIEETQERFPWKKNMQWLAKDMDWPAPGKRLVFSYKAGEALPAAVKDITVDIYYEMYDDMPVVSKWMVIHNHGKVSIHLDRFKSEILALTETAPKVAEGAPREYRIFGSSEAPESAAQMDAPRDYVDRFTQLFVVTDYAMGGDMEAMKDNPGVRWRFDHPEYEKTGIRYYGQYKPARVECTPPFGPAETVDGGESFESFRAFELLHDSDDRERRGLAERKFWRAMAPWSQENPLFMHVRNAEPEAVRLAIDQCAEVGFDMVIMTFGSGFSIENETPAYLQQMKELNEYARQKGIVLGGYSLLASRGGKDESLVISQKTQEIAKNYRDGARFGKTPCLATDWGENYFRLLYQFFEETGMGVFEHDGSYPGDMCASTDHSGHEGFDDSQWKQWMKVRDFYQWLRGRGVYLNVPDWYFLSGSSKTAMGYVETNWSLPRAQQKIIERQNIFDGTWQKTPSMGWMFIPLTQYHGGGAAATIEPLHEHLEHYKKRMMNLFGAGVQAIYRGPRLYDTDETKEAVKEMVRFYKKHKEILDSDIIHLRRPDGRDWDGFVHVNPNGAEKGLVMLYNPTSGSIKKVINIPLYYTGKHDEVSVASEKGETRTIRVNRDYSIDLEVEIPANDYSWYILK